MLKLLKTAVGANRSSASSTTSNGDGIEVRVGRPNARTLTISRSALKSSSVLRRTMVQGCHILNADPIVFAVILEYLESRRILERIRSGTRNPLAQLTTGNDMLCKLAKAWHIANMLQLPQLQNKLVDTFRETYMHHLKSHTRLRVEPEPFVYLATYLGTFSKIEKFIIDFYTGLSRFGGEFTEEELEPLPRGIATTLRHRRERFVAQGFLGDLIASNNECFDVTGSEYILHLPLQVALPYVQPSTSSIASAPSARRGISISSITSFFSSSSNRTNAPPSTGLPPPPPRGTRHRVRLFIPGITTLNGQSEVLVSRTAMPGIQPTFGESVHPRANRSNSMMTLLPSRAPFMPPPPRLRRARTTPPPEEDSSTDGENESGLFPSRLKSCEDQVRDDKYGAVGGRGDKDGNGEDGNGGTGREDEG
ncbi:hypothetical protein CFE70_007881 [Pyrenophora teres f. teres 0-1]|uniref:BTB domain-containing protein n=2 Tax=Pyrenophora teres f. teres TaxID=97479 RepID=E3RQ87_PYRTT|nr:hypothetical protein PTT_10859 [Pyrenophora teres f. teres 0-1]CAE7199406.1 hypothetical protein PTTW11_08452 [Pyrenophora teres f. teres]